MIRSEIIGTGSYLPEKVLTNFDLEKMVDTSDEWIRERTGIIERHIVENEKTSDLGFMAAKNALEAAGITAGDVDLLIVATTTPDNVFPATAARIQSLLGMSGGAAFDIQAVCSGFIYALNVADSLLKSGSFRTAVVIGCETMSRIIDWSDRNTCVLFGDGAGAVVLRSCESGGSIKDKGIIDTIIRSDGTKYDVLMATGGVSSPDKSIGHIIMQGREVYKHAVVNLADIAEELLAKHNIGKDDLSLFIPHQANLRIIESTAKKLDFPLEKTVVTLYHHANTSAASIPLALDHAVKTGKAKSGDLALLDAMGAGFTWGASLIRL